jgi:chorismate mutase
VLEKVRQSAQDLAGPLTSEALVRIFERIIDEARRAERESGSTHDDFGPSIGE